MAAAAGRDNTEISARDLLVAFNFLLSALFYQGH